MLDAAWPQGLGNSTWISAAALDLKTRVLHVSARNAASPILMFHVDSEYGPLLGSWGDEDIFFDATSQAWGGHGLVYEARREQIWVADILDHTVKVFSATTAPPNLVAISGTPGEAGSALEPLQFGSVADVASSPDGHIFVSDGDGGINNRVLQLNATSQESLIGSPLWVLGGAASEATQEFSSPHSIAFHAPSRNLLVANRDQFSLDVLSADTGKKVAQWTTCFEGSAEQVVLAEGTAAPWGIRIVHPRGLQGDFISRPLAFLAVANSPQDGGNQRIVVIDVSHNGSFSQSTGNCTVLAEIPVDPSLCRTPHEIEVDPVSGDIFVACVTVDPGPSTLLRYRRQEKGQQ